MQREAVDINASKTPVSPAVREMLLIFTYLF